MPRRWSARCSRMRNATSGTRGQCRSTARRTTSSESLPSCAVTWRRRRFASKRRWRRTPRTELRCAPRCLGGGLDGKTEGAVRRGRGLAQQPKKKPKNKKGQQKEGGKNEGPE